MTEQDSSYRPRSPDFSSYRPRSPDFSSFQPSLPSPAVPQPTYQFGAHRPSYDASPFFTQYQQPSLVSPRASQQYVPPFSDVKIDVPQFSEINFDADMARRSSRLARTVDVAPAPIPEPKFMEPIEPAPVAVPILPEEPEPPKLDPAAGIEVKTKFPVARIKRIMQADEDVGKVAQVTPIAVSKALELFMISLVTKAAKEAKDRNSKRVTASHLKQAVAKDEVLDFLADIIAKVPDQPAGRKHDDDGSDQNDQPKRKRGGRRPKDDSD
ncbi:histone-fold-containing protein [Aspergillus karnatakaensis]|uniref:negative cofactor 2 transcription regulator complex subunit BUR6 n=1 Tax=Aspergillus karnatakaensis TaxID=1810916 RepID=UPI003CCD8584